VKAYDIVFDHTPEGATERVWSYDAMNRDMDSTPDKVTESGWLGNAGPNIPDNQWPRSSHSGLPMQHIFTLHLPEEYRTQTRGGKGLINMKVTDKTGPVVGIRVVRENQELMLITTDGIVIRTTVDEISLISRNTQGVKLMTLGESDRVASMATMNRIVDAPSE